MKVETIYEIGQKANQEDYIYLPSRVAANAGSCRVFVLCDGMGGHEHGEVASSIVANTIGEVTSASCANTVAEMRSAFNEALNCAYEKLDRADTSDSVRKMGTTLTFLAFCADGVLVAHIGDSRVYQLRPSEGIVFQTRDHSLVNDLLAAGELTEEEARTYPQRNVITRAVMPHQEYRSKATFRVLTDVRQHDVFMLCSDGIVEQVDNNLLTTILLENKSLAERSQDLRNVCATCHTRDNHSCILLELDETPTFFSPQQIMPKNSRRKFSLWLLILVTAIAAGTAFLLFSKCRTKETSLSTPVIHNTQQPTSAARRIEKPVKDETLDAQKKPVEKQNPGTSSLLRKDVKKTLKEENLGQGDVLKSETKLQNGNKQ